jgi:hypothetical protein
MMLKKAFDRKRTQRSAKFGSGAVWLGSEPNARLMCRKERDTPRGSPRSFAAQNTLAQDDIKLHHYPKFAKRT